MPAEVNQTDSGNYSVVHAVASGDVSVGDIFFESTGFGLLVFSTRARAAAVANAINAELEERSKSFVDQIKATLKTDTP